MSSSNWLSSARRYGNNFTGKIKNLENSFNNKVTSDSADEGEDLQTRTEGGIGRSMAKFCDADLNYAKTLDPTKLSYLAFEPDYNTCKLLVEFDSTGGEITDYSGFNHHARSYGISRLTKGIDYGDGGSIEVEFDGRSAYCEIPHDSDLNFSNVSTGFSILARIKPNSLAATGGAGPIVFCKRESAPDVNDWYSFEISGQGRAIFNLVKGGTIRSIVTPTGVLNTTNHFDIAVTYQQSNGAMKLFVNNTKYDTVNNTLQFGTQTPSSDTFNLKVGRYDPKVSPPPGEKYPQRADSKLYFGCIQQLKYFRNKVLSDAEVGYHFTNKLTVVNIPFGQVARAGLLVLDPTP